MSDLQAVVNNLDPYLERVIHACQTGVIPVVILSIDEQDEATKATRDILSKGRKGETFIWMDPAALRKKLETKNKWFSSVELPHIKIVVLTGRELLCVNYLHNEWSTEPSGGAVAKAGRLSRIGGRYAR